MGRPSCGTQARVAWKGSSAPWWRKLMDGGTKPLENLCMKTNWHFLMDEKTIDMRLWKKLRNYLIFCSYTLISNQLKDNLETLGLGVGREWVCWFLPFLSDHTRRYWIYLNKGRRMWMLLATQGKRIKRMSKREASRASHLGVQLPLILSGHNMVQT